MDSVSGHALIEPGGVAVIGMGFRFPGASTQEKFWKNVSLGVESITRFSRSQLKAAGVPDEVAEDPLYVPANAVLDDIEGLDAGLFKLRDHEARLMDPQQRLVLECCWEAFEDAGMAPLSGARNVGVFAGCSISTYLLYNVWSQLDRSGADFNLDKLITNDKDYLASGVGYRFNLTGPAITIQTACSSSLVAIHYACQALLNYECDMALAGGATVRVPHRVGYLHQGGSMLSPDGHCRPFDARAAGTVPGSGAGIVLLKRLGDARRDGDPVHAVIRGSAANADGADKIGFTAPSPAGQAQVIAAALAAAEVSADTIGYVEAHGTATGLGDPIELAGLTQAYRHQTDRRGFCALGSVKGNIGHLEAAAGVAGLIKTILALKQRQIPPSLHFESPNQRIDFEGSPFRVNDHLVDWPVRGGTRLAGVSSFGFGGVNCHVVLEEAPAPPPSPQSGAGDRSHHVLTVSARTPEALEQLAHDMADALLGDAAPALADVCRAASLGRTHFECRLALVGSTSDELVRTLDEFSAVKPAVAAASKIAFVFAGDGSHHPGMARALFATEPVFRRHMQACDAILRPLIGGSLLEALYPSSGISNSLDRPAWGQAALFSLEYSLAQLWRAWGIKPAACLGHGVGEIAAACDAGILILDDAMRLTVRRAALMQDLPPPDLAHAMEAAARHMVHGQPRTPFIDRLTGHPAGEVDAAYWGRQGGAAELLDRIDRPAQPGCEILLDIGPRPTPAGLRFGDGQAGVWLSALDPEKPDTLAVMLAVAGLYESGIDLDWTAFHAGHGQRKAALPFYPFQRQRYWIDAVVTKDQAQLAHPLLGRAIKSPLATLQFENKVSADGLLGGHKVGAATLMPATGYIETMRAAATESSGDVALQLLDVFFDAPLVLHEAQETAMHVVVRGAEIEVYAESADGSWMRHAASTIAAADGNRPPPLDLAALQAHCRLEVSRQALYDHFDRCGLDYAESFRRVSRLWRGDGSILAQIEPMAGSDDDPSFMLHPALLDSALQAAALLAPDVEGHAFLPVWVERVEIHSSLRMRCWCYATLREVNDRTVAVNIVVADARGQLIVSLHNFRSRCALASSVATAGNANRPDLFEIGWQAAARPSAPTVRKGAWALVGADDAMAAALGYRLQDDVHRVHRLAVTETDSLSEMPDLAGVVYLAGLNEAISEQARLNDLLTTIHAVLRRPDRTETVFAVAARDEEAGPAFRFVAAPVLRVLGEEHSELHWRIVTLDDAPADALSALLHDEITMGGDESETAWRHGRRLAPRLERINPRGGILTKGAYQLAANPPGTLEALAFLPAPIPEPGPGEVVVKVTASALNFRDLLKALDLYPDPDRRLGDECAGEIVAVGAGVTDLVIGQQVVAVAAGAFRSHAVATQELVVPRPRGLTDAEATASPIAFLTAQYALEVVGRVRSGDRVLIHSAAGGVGMAAIQICRRAGAEIYATAGRPEKREALRRLGIRHVWDSRTTDFAAGILDATDGQGIDIVLNSLTGDAIPASLDSLRPGGQMLELGKIGIWDPQQVEHAFPDVVYRIVAMDEVSARELPTLRTMLAQLMDDLSSGQLQPLPVRGFALADAPEAFRHIQQARQIGKVVLIHPRQGIRRDGTYLISGGFGALGLETARHCAAAGAGCLMLVGRTPPGEAALTAIADLERRGCRILRAQADVSRDEDVARLLADIDAAGTGLHGIFHAAGIHKGSTVANLDAGIVDEVFAGKARGAWALHRATRHRPLDLFVLFGSITSSLGLIGSAAYAAANGYLAALAHLRQREGLPALCIDWGRWSIGMSADVSDLERARIDTLGLDEFPAEAGSQALAALLETQGASAQTIVAGITWRRFLDRHPTARRSSLFRAQAQTAVKAKPAAGAGGLRAELEAQPSAARYGFLVERIVAMAEAVAGKAAGPIEAHIGLAEIGFDSLMSIELRNTLSNAVGMKLPATVIFDHPTLERLARYVLDVLLRPLQSSAPEPAAAPLAGSPPEQAADDPEDMSEEALSQLLGNELAQWRELSTP